MIDLAPLRDVSIIADLVLAMWFFRLRWYGLASTTAACIAASLIVG